MSRLIDTLTRLKQPEPRQIGFMVTQPSAAKTRMQLVALYNAENQEKVSSSVKSADATIIEISKSGDIDGLDKACQAKDGVPTGGRIKTTSGATIKKLMNVSCDFITFPATAPLTVTQKEKMGRILEVDASLSEGLLRTANDLPIDAVLVSDKEDESSLTLNRLMFIQRLIYLTGKPILVPISDGLTSADLQALWDMGVTGVVVEVTDEKSGDKLAELRGYLEKLNPPAFRKKSRMSVIAPRCEPEPEQPHPDEDGEEEDE